MSVASFFMCIFATGIYCFRKAAYFKMKYDT